MKKIITTTCIVVKGSQLLLGMKKRGFGQGRWNGFGGKLKDGESLEESVKREVLEETELQVENPELLGVMDFEYQGKDEIYEVNIFRITEFQGEPQESEEMRPQWFEKNNLPFDAMWPDDIYWMPLFLAGKKFTGKFLYEGYDKILEYELIKI
jgi:8-oxo-dGTP diphosphatase / 2-hydroxy-dATP diphosphatase